MKRKHIIIIAVASLVALGGAFALYHFVVKQDKPQYSGPTEQELKETEENKKKVAEREQIEEDAKNNPPSSQNGKKNVTPIIINASQNGQEIFISASVGGVFEDGGTCTATIKQGDKSLSYTSAAFADATTTSCAPFKINRDDFTTTGTWTVVVSYASGTAEGESAAADLVVQ